MESKSQVVTAPGIQPAPATIPPWRKWLTRIGGVIAAAVITVGAFMLRGTLTAFAQYGYVGVFLISLLGNATVFIPAPSYAIVFAVSGALSPVLVGIVAGLGASLGELTGYLAGTSGRTAIINTEAYKRFAPLIQKYDVFAIFLLAAIPNPFFDVAGILSGMLRIPAWQFVLAAWAGKALRFTLVALLGATSVPFLLNRILSG